MGLAIGYFSALLLMPTGTNLLRNILWGAWLGIAFGLSTRMAYKIAFLSILGSTIFTITSIYKCDPVAGNNPL